VHAKIFGTKSAQCLEFPLKYSSQKKKKKKKRKEKEEGKKVGERGGRTDEISMVKLASYRNWLMGS
jgi:hypothetical protein